MTIQRPIKYIKKCHWCRAIVCVPEKEMRWKDANAFKCPVCDNTVFFTDSYGELTGDVLVEYNREENV